MVIRELYAHYMKHHAPTLRAPYRVEQTWKFLRRPFGNLTVEELTPYKIKRYVQAREKHLAHTTIRRELNVLISFINYGHRDGLCPPMPKFNLPKERDPRKRILSEDEVAKFLEACADNPPLLLYVQLALLTAQRKTAIIELKWSQVDWVQNVIDFNDSSQRSAERMKGRGVLPMVGDLYEVMLSAAHSANNYMNNYVIGDYNGHGFNVDRHFRKTVRSLGWSDVSSHTLRHTVASRLVQGGVPLLPVSRLLGHKSITTTERNYTHLTPDFIGEAVGKLTLKRSSDV